MLSFSQEGQSGRAPILFFDDPAINRLPPQPGILGDGGRVPRLRAHRELRRRRAAHARRLHRRPEGRRDRAARGARGAHRRVRDLGREARPRRLPHRHHQARRERLLAGLRRQRRASASRPRARTTSSCSARRSTATTQLLGSYTRPGALDSVFYFSQHFTAFANVFENAHDPTTAQGTEQIQSLWEPEAARTTARSRSRAASASRRTRRSSTSSTTTTCRASSSRRTGDMAALRNALTCSSPRTGSPTSTTAPSRSSPAATIRPTARCSGPPASRRTATRSRTSPSSRASARRTSRCAAATRRSCGRPTTSRSEDDAGIFAFERAGGDAGSGPYALVVLNTNGFKASSTSHGGTVMQTSAAGRDQARRRARSGCRRATR